MRSDLGAPASSVSLWGGGGEDWSCPPSGLQADLAGPQRPNSPSLQGPLPHLIYRTPLLPVPFECREPGKEGKVGLRDGCAPLTRPLPPGCLFATAARSAPLSRLRLRRKRQVRGPRRPRAAETSGCGPAQDTLIHGWGKGLKLMWLEAREPCLGGSPPTP